MKRFGTWAVMGVVAVGLVAAVLLVARRPAAPDPAPYPTPDPAPCSGLTEIYQLRDCMNRNWNPQNSVVSVHDADGKIHLEVQAGKGAAVGQWLSEIGIPADKVVVTELQPSRTGSEWEPADGPRLEHRLLASEKRLPPWEAMQGHSIIIKLAEDADQFRQLWSLFQLEGAPPSDVDWQTEAVIFVGLGESGSCPLKLDGFSRAPDDLLRAHVAYAGEFYVCTGDYSPRTFVAAVKSDSLPAGMIRATVKSQFGEPVLFLRVPPTSACISAPTRIEPGSGQVAVYFTCTGDPVPSAARGVLRETDPGKPALQAALEELLKGPGIEERAQGFTSHFSSETASMLKSVTITDQGRAIVDFADVRAHMNNASTSAGSAQLMSELKQTVFQYAEIREAEFRIDGSCETFWNWLQSDCQIIRP